MRSPQRPRADQRHGDCAAMDWPASTQTTVPLWRMEREKEAWSSFMTPGDRFRPSVDTSGQPLGRRSARPWINAAESLKAQTSVELQPAGIKGGQLQGGTSKFQCQRHHTMLWAWCSAGNGIVARVDANGGPRCCGNGDPESIATSQARVQRLDCLLYTSPSPRDISGSRMPSSA